MKKKIKIVEHGTQWVDPNPPLVIICPECGGEKLVSRVIRDSYYKNFFIVYLERESNCKECKDCGCVFEIDSKITAKTESYRTAFVIFLISLIIMIALITFITNYETAEEAPVLLVVGLLSSIISTLVSFSIWLALI